MMNENCKTTNIPMGCEVKPEPVPTMGYLERELRETLFKIDDMLGQIMQRTFCEVPIEIKVEEPTCLMHNVFLNLENAKIIAENINYLASKIL